MAVEVIVRVTPEGQLEMPPEVKAQLRPGDEYAMSVTEDAIVFKKLPKPLTWDELSRRIENQKADTIKPSVDLDKFFQELEQLEPDPNQLSMEEICEIVKEVRREMGAKE